MALTPPHIPREADARRPGWRAGVWVVLGRHGRWSFPIPRPVPRVLVGDRGSIIVVEWEANDSPLPDWRELVAATQTAEAGTPRIAAFCDLFTTALCRNYVLTDEQAAWLLVDVYAACDMAALTPLFERVLCEPLEAAARIGNHYLDAIEADVSSN